MGILDSIRKGMDTTGQFLGLPVISPLLEIPQQIHNQGNARQVQGALQQLEQGTQPGPSHLLYPGSPQMGGQGQTPPGTPLPHAAAPQQGALRALTQNISPQPGQPPSPSGHYNLDPLLPSNARAGQPLPQPGPSPGMQRAAGPPQLVPGQQNPYGTKEFLNTLKKIYSPGDLTRLKTEDPSQYKRVMAYRGMASYDQGNAQGAVGDLTESGLPVGDAIAILQQQKGQKALQDFGSGLTGQTGGGPSGGPLSGMKPSQPGTSPPSNQTATQGAPIGQTGPATGYPAGMVLNSAGTPQTRESFLAQNMPKLASLPAAQRQQGMMMLQSQANRLPTTQQVGPLMASRALPAFMEGLAKVQHPGDLQSFLASAIAKVPANARPAFNAMIQHPVSQWNQNYALKQKDSTLTGPALDLAAKQYLATGTMPSFGMGGQRQKEAIMNRSAQMAQQEGQSPSDIVMNQNELKTGRQALGQIQKSQGMIMQYEETARKNADLALKASEKTDRFGSPVFNRWLIAGRTAIGGSPEVARFNAANQTFISEYAKVMSGGYGAGATSDSARQEAGAMLQTAQTPEQYAAVVDQLKQEMGNRMQAMQDTRSFLENGLRNAISGKKGSVPTLSGGSQSASHPSGRVPMSYKGQTGSFDPKTKTFYPDASQK